MEIVCISIKHANCYVIKVKDFYIAIDAGWSGHINEYLKGLYEHKIRPEKIRYLFMTHFHPDHAGLIEDLKAFGTQFVLFEHQAPFIDVMEKMLLKDKHYKPLNRQNNILLNIETSKAFFDQNQIPGQAIKTVGHSEDSISIVMDDGSAFIGDLYMKELIMDEDVKSQESWNALEKAGVKRIYAAHGNGYGVEIKFYN